MTGRAGLKPLVFAHRGSSASHPEHTLDAYLTAIDEGADGLECDVRLTRDGHLVCLHDSRLDRTSDGRGRVSVRTLADLEKLDFGRTARVLTLEQLITVALDAGRPLRLLIETKHPVRYGGAVETALVDLLGRFDLIKTRHPVAVSVMSFSPTAIRRIRLLAPELPTVMLMELPVFLARPGLLPFGTTIGGPGVDVLRKAPMVVERMHRNGNEVYVWTVNTPAEVDLVLHLGVEGIITDRPAYVLSRLDERTSPDPV
jgi:glycerophosphoryl diester phosphodiesterase